MQDILKILEELLIDNGLILAFLIVGILSLFSNFVSSKLTRGRIHNSAIAIFLGLIIAYVGGRLAIHYGYIDALNPKSIEKAKGIADIPLFAGIGILGGNSFRDFAIISTAYGAKISEIKKCGLAGIVALLTGVILTFFVGAAIAVAFGFKNPADISTIAAGTVTFVVGPVTGKALGASEAVQALSVAAGVIKSVLVMVATPMVAKKIGLTTPRSAMIFGGLIGTTSGTSAGLAATNPELVPYGAMTATFYTGLGCLLCPSVLHWVITMIV